ncbi:unnamed protein product [Soboliphyme baturini]|uniref:Ig-like domain-containing protein n=1 Tax=Soboliphyme baturini TaxID=241478 RepID=A0A183J310_9BILA|nr:unnamed protein product [Soboliphyme baturini]
MTIAHEGIPYEGVLCTKGPRNNLVWKMVTGPETMVVNPGSGVLSCYAPVIRSVNRTDHNTFVIDGYVKFLKVFMRRVPIVLKTYVKECFEQSMTFWSTDSGRFVAEYVSPLEPVESLTFTVCHPAMATLNSSALANEGESYTVLLDRLQFLPEANPVRCPMAERCSFRAMLKNIGYRDVHEIELKLFKSSDGRQTVVMNSIHLSALKSTAVAHVNIELAFLPRNLVECTFRLTAKEGIDILVPVNLVVPSTNGAWLFDPPTVSLQKNGPMLFPSTTTVEEKLCAIN